ncbi:unnamed protein product [Sphagnum troendelagicum]
MMCSLLMRVRMILCDRSVFRRDKFCGRITRDEHDRHENDRMHLGFEIPRAVVIHAIGEGHQEGVRVGRRIPVLSYLKLQNFKVFITRRTGEFGRHLGRLSYRSRMRPNSEFSRIEK